MAAKPKQTRQTIMIAAYEIAAQKGLRAVTVREVAARAKISVGLIYYHFKDIPQIFRMVLMHHYQQIMNYLNEQMADSDDPLLRYMAAITINIQFTSSRQVFRDISRVVPFSSITRDSDYFALVKQGFKSIQETMHLGRNPAMLDAAVFAFIGAFETVKSAYYRSMISLTPYEITKLIFLQAFTPVGMDGGEIESRVPKVEKICRNTKRKDIAVPWLATVHDDAPGFNQVTLHELGQKDA